MKEAVSPLAGGARIATKIAELVEQTADRDYRYIVATRDHHIDPGGTSPRPRTSRTASPSTAWQVNEGSEFHPHFALAVTGGKVAAVFNKGAHSASKSGFEGADEAGTRAHHVEDVDVVGIATNHGVRATALDAVKAGFRAQVRLDYSPAEATDCCSRLPDRAGRPPRGQRLVAMALAPVPILDHRHGSGGSATHERIDCPAT
ncbi:isochorismatase family protein [Streptomyces sp. DH10]|uniref:isochorismatase family protein n=1 Tax=Streptomyces sp. DH10 TaxID=3040121 RepID=UPI00244194B2|nr:isochorismatase family protein [Streptomyces sp. DH10]MDG9709484.1 isochorismatase family protein [Streptomyces sp. DH10]